MLTTRHDQTLCNFHAAFGIWTLGTGALSEGFVKYALIARRSLRAFHEGCNLRVAEYVSTSSTYR
eukprot:jgi/Botrbrau1/14945/Bobra.0018s0049.1